MTYRKRCSACGRLRSETKFYTARDTADGLRGQCRDCQLAKRKELYYAKKSKKSVVKEVQAPAIKIETPTLVGFMYNGKFLSLNDVEKKLIDMRYYRKQATIFTVITAITWFGICAYMFYNFVK